MERNAAGKYKSLEDFISRTSPLGVNKRAVENFIKAGALDSAWSDKKTNDGMFMFKSWIQRHRKEKTPWQVK